MLVNSNLKLDLRTLIISSDLLLRPKYHLLYNSLLPDDIHEL
jgi:hypothetical protein